MPTRPLLPVTIFGHPLDGIVGIRALVYCGAVLSIARRALHNEHSFRFESTADVLKGEDIAVLIQEFIAARRGTLVGRHSIRSAHKKNGQRRGTAFRREDNRMEFHAVAHRDHVLGYVEEVGASRR